jgi:hypothetical protein
MRPLKHVCQGDGRRLAIRVLGQLLRDAVVFPAIRARLLVATNEDRICQTLLGITRGMESRALFWGPVACLHGWSQREGSASCLQERKQHLSVLIELRLSCLGGILSAGCQLGRVDLVGIRIGRFGLSVSGVGLGAIGEELISQLADLTQI